MNNTLKLPTSLKLFCIICKNMFNLVKANIAEFAAYKPFYTTDYVDKLLLQLKNAGKLPTTNITTAQRKQARVKLIKQGKDLRNKWKMLKGYITHAFDKDLHRTQLEEAGYIYFQDGAINWASIQSLGEAALKYTLKNDSILSDRNNMPRTFLATLQNSINDFENALEIFNDANTTKVEGVSLQAETYNALYQILADISNDSVNVFEKDTKKRKLFSIQYHIDVMKRSSAGLKGYLKDENGLPLAGVLLASSNEKYKSFTDQNGYFRMDKMAEGEYDFAFAKQGYIPLQIRIELEAGTAKTVHLKMAKAQPATMEAVA